MKQFQVFLLCLSLPLGLRGQPATQSIPLLIINHVTVIDPTTSASKRDMSVVIMGDRIRSITPYSRAMRSANVVVVDAREKFLVAGLWDMHVHSLSKGHPDRFFPLFVANGVTGIRDMGGDISLEQIARLRKEISNGSRLGPEIYAAGPILEGEHRFWPFSLSVKDQAEAHRTISELINERADFLKVYNTLSREVYLAIASEANAPEFHSWATSLTALHLRKLLILGRKASSICGASLSTCRPILSNSRKSWSKQIMLTTRRLRATCFTGSTRQSYRPMIRRKPILYLKSLPTTAPGRPPL